MLCQTVLSTRKVEQFRGIADGRGDRCRVPRDVLPTKCMWMTGRRDFRGCPLRPVASPLFSPAVNTSHLEGVPRVRVTVLRIQWSIKDQFRVLLDSEVSDEHTIKVVEKSREMV